MEGTEYSFCKTSSIKSQKRWLLDEEMKNEPDCAKLNSQKLQSSTKKDVFFIMI